MTDTDPATPNLSSPAHGLTYDVVVVGGGAAGLSTAASILKRRGGITVAIIEPSGSHFYQPGWTLVGGGVFKQSQTRRSEKRLIPSGADWVQAAATGFEPESNLVHLSNGSSIRYEVLVVATGLTLDWDGIEGLSETLGRNGVTSNYRYDLAPTRGSWCRRWAVATPCSPSRPCPSNARARRRRRFTWPVTHGADGDFPTISTYPSTPPRQGCSG